MPGRPKGATNFTDAERSEALRLQKQYGYSIKQIAEELGRSPQTITDFFKSIKSTAHLARAEAEAAEVEMMRQFIATCNNEQKLEFFDRTKTLEKQRDAAGGITFSLAVVGLPGAPALTPPTREQFEAAKALQVKALPVITIEAEKS